MKTRIDRDTCIGCGLCADNVPDVYEMDNEGIAVAKQPEVPTNLERDVKNAAADCPVEAIKVKD